jgi:hypothetical protein
MTKVLSAPDPVSADGAQVPGLGQPYGLWKLLLEAGPFPFVTEIIIHWSLVVK